MKVTFDKNYYIHVEIPKDYPKKKIKRDMVKKLAECLVENRLIREDCRNSEFSEHVIYRIYILAGSTKIKLP